MRGMGLHMGLSKRRRIRTNKCENYNANPTDLTGVGKAGDAAATLAVVDDAAAITAAGGEVARLCTGGKAYKLDNSLGTGVATAFVNGASGSTATHTMSAYVRGGSGGFSQFSSGSPIMGAFTSSASYVRRSTSWSPSDANRILTIVAGAGQIIYFVLNQFESGSSATLPVIVTTGAASTVYY